MLEILILLLMANNFPNPIEALHKNKIILELNDSLFEEPLSLSIDKPKPFHINAAFASSEMILKAAKEIDPFHFICEGEALPLSEDLVTFACIIHVLTKIKSVEYWYAFCAAYSEAHEQLQNFISTCTVGVDENFTEPVIQE